MNEIKVGVIPKKILNKINEKVSNLLSQNNGRILKISDLVNKQKITLIEMSEIIDFSPYSNLYSVRSIGLKKFAGATFEDYSIEYIH